MYGLSIISELSLVLSSAESCFFKRTILMHKPDLLNVLVDLT
jgi:hypothetical protein